MEEIGCSRNGRKTRPGTEEELRVKVYQRCVWVQWSMMML